MRMITRVLAGIALPCLLVGCSGQTTESGGPSKTGTEPVKPDVTLPLADYLKETRADHKAAREKYRGKVLEMTATVWAVTGKEPFWDLQVIEGIHPTEKLPVIGSIVLSKGDAGKEKELRLLTRGQQVTLRATGNPGPGLDLNDVRIVESGPSTARPVTLIELDRAMKVPAEQAKYQELDVLVRVKLLEPGSKNSPDLWTVTDPAGMSGLRVRIGNGGFNAFRSELEARKPGDVLLLLASPMEYQGQWSLGNARIVTEPPAGVQLPPEGK